MPILHRTRTLQALLPRYVTRFRCKAQDCEDSCCSGWQITIDKKTHDAYHGIAHPELAAKIAQSVTRKADAPHELAYGRIELAPATAQCQLLDGGLCGVQKTMGETYLSHTCHAYPRVSSDFGGQFEQVLELSCPEAARQALLAPDAFDFVEGPITVRPELVRTVRPNGEFSAELMNELRIFCIKLVRTDALELWQRLAVLGVVCESVGPALAAQDNAALRSLLDSFVALVEGGHAVAALEGLQPNHAAQAMVFSAIWAGIGFVTSSAAQNKVIAAVAAGLGADPQTGSVSGARLVESYSRGVQRLPEALQAAPHLLDHYLLNEIIRNLFPFDSPTPYASYLQLVSRFGLLRLMLAARCNTEGPLPDAATLAETVQVYCRRFEHDPEFARRVNASLASSGWASLDKLYSFLRH